MAASAVATASDRFPRRQSQLPGAANIGATRPAISEAARPRNGIGVALAGLAGALLAPLFLVYPTNGVVTTVKGFEIIVIGGLGSIPGALLGSRLTGRLSVPALLRTVAVILLVAGTAAILQGVL